jgi:hypothetical protein
MEENKKRQPYLIGFIGTNRTGKTSTAIEIVKAYKKSNPKNDIVTFDPQAKFTEYSNYQIQDVLDLNNLIDKKDFLLVMDDYQALLQSDKMHHLFTTLLTYRAENGVDIIFITHHPSLIKQQLSYYMTHLFIFYCNLSDDVVGINKKVVNADKIEKLFREIEQEFIKNGGGEYPKFKHIVYSNQEDKHKKVNF